MESQNEPYMRVKSVNEDFVKSTIQNNTNQDMYYQHHDVANNSQGNNQNEQVVAVSSNNQDYVQADPPVAQPQHRTGSNEQQMHQIKLNLDKQDSDLKYKSPSPNKRNYGSPTKRDKKSMADTLKKIPTPKSKPYAVQRIMEDRKSRVLQLQIDVVEPEYDNEGQPIHADMEDETTPPHMDQIFNAHLLDEEYMDAQRYTGELYSSDSDSQL